MNELSLNELDDAVLLEVLRFAGLQCLRQALLRNRSLSF